MLRNNVGSGQCCQWSVLTVVSFDSAPLPIFPLVQFCMRQILPDMYFTVLSFHVHCLYVVRIRWLDLSWQYLFCGHFSLRLTIWRKNSKSRHNITFQVLSNQHSRQNWRSFRICGTHTRYHQARHRNLKKGRFSNRCCCARALKNRLLYQAAFGETSARIIWARALRLRPVCKARVSVIRADRAPFLWHTPLNRK